MFPKFFLTIALLLATFIFCTSIALAQDSSKPKVAVVDFGQLNGAMTGKLNTDKIGAMCIDYIVEALVESGKFYLMSRELVADKLAEEKLNIIGNIPPSAIRRIGEIIGADYLIIGNVYGVGGDQSVIEIASNGAKINSVKACLIARMVEVSTGKIVAMAEGRGESKSSLVKVGKKDFGFITIGTKSIPQVSVHNSVKKAAFSLVQDFLKTYSARRS